MVKLVVLDVNDNRPEFYLSQYNISMEEGSSVGQEVVAVHARDLDSGAFGLITYRISSGNSQGYFTINANTGVITVAKSLSSTQRLYTLTVSAMDGGSLASSSDAVVRISILDASQSHRAAVFTKSLYQFNVKEGLPTRSVVGRVSATSSNSGMYIVSATTY